MQLAALFTLASDNTCGNYTKPRSKSGNSPSGESATRRHSGRGIKEDLDSLAESGDGGKVSSQKAVLHEAPQSFNQIEVRGIRRQKEEFNTASGLGAPFGISSMTIMSGLAPVWSLSLPVEDYRKVGVGSRHPSGNE